MAVEYFMADPAIQQKAWDLIGQRHPEIGGCLNKGELVIVFREKASKAGGQVILGGAKKAAPLVNALAGENFVFILELAKDQWIELSSKKQEALLDHLLCACNAEEDPKTGTWKFSVIKPDVQAYRRNVEEYGMWFPTSDEDEQSSGPDPVADMFAPDKDKDGSDGDADDS
jgi:hypothetical protein